MRKEPRMRKNHRKAQTVFIPTDFGNDDQIPIRTGFFVRLSLDSIGVQSTGFLVFQPRESGGSAVQKDGDTDLSIVEDLSVQIPTIILKKHARLSLFASSFGDRPNSLTIMLMQEIE